MIKTIKSYRDLEVWQKAMQLVEDVYKATQAFPREEQFALTNQMRRAAVAVPSNIAEGHGRTGPKEYLHFLSIAHGSVMELETQVLIAQRLGYLEPEKSDCMLQGAGSVSMMLRALISKLQVV
jgi:four helix bundle protein